MPAGQSTALLFLRGGGRVNGSKSVDEGELAVLDREGEALSIEAGPDSTVLLLSGTPIDEPVAGYGPFVMNTESEIRTGDRRLPQRARWGTWTDASGR